MIIIAGLVILIAADAILALYAIESTTRFSRNELAGQKTQIKLLKADIKRALAIQRSIPQTKADCERFENSLYASSAGYSAVTDEMTGFAKQAGLQVVSLALDRKSTRLNSSHLVISYAVFCLKKKKKKHKTLYR